MSLLDFFRRKPPIRDLAALADFIDQNAAFLVQKGIYEYSRARAGHYAKVLFGEPDFRTAVEESRWRAYPLGLAMVAEMVDRRAAAGWRPGAAGATRCANSCSRSSIAIRCRRRSAPTPGRGARRTVRAPGCSIGLHPPKRVIDIPEPFARRLFRLHADPREAARQRLSDHQELSHGDALQHP